MGAAIAANILKAGHYLRVWNRSPEKAEHLVSRGATLARTPREAAEGRDIVITMLADDASSSMSGHRNPQSWRNAALRTTTPPT